MTNYKQTQKSVTSSSAQLIAANRDRKALIIFNTGANAMQFGLGVASITIDAGDHAAFLEKPPTSALLGISSSGTTAIIWEA